MPPPTLHTLELALRNAPPITHTPLCNPSERNRNTPFLDTALAAYHSLSPTTPIDYELMAEGSRNPCFARLHTAFLNLARTNRFR